MFWTVRQTSTGIRRGQSFWWAFGAGFRASSHSTLFSYTLHTGCSAVTHPPPHFLSLIHRFFPRVNVNKTLFDLNLREAMPKCTKLVGAYPIYIFLPLTKTKWRRADILILPKIKNGMSLILAENFYRPSPAEIFTKRQNNEILTHDNIKTMTFHFSSGLFVRKNTILC